MPARAQDRYEDSCSECGVDVNVALCPSSDSGKPNAGGSLGVRCVIKLSDRGAEMKAERKEEDLVTHSAVKRHFLLPVHLTGVSLVVYLCSQNHL